MCLQRSFLFCANVLDDDVMGKFQLILHAFDDLTAYMFDVTSNLLLADVGIDVLYYLYVRPCINEKSCNKSNLLFFYEPFLTVH